MRTLLFTIATALTFSGTPYAFASEVRPGPEEWINTTHVVRLLNGNELRGDLIDRNDRTVTLELDSLGTYAIPVESVDQVLAEDGKIALPPRVPEFTMDVGITRALPVEGVKLPDEAAIAAGVFVPGCAPGSASHAHSFGMPWTPPPENYPPTRGGLRGSHAGSFETAHELVLQGRSDWDPVDDSEPEYDLVVVGGVRCDGLSSCFRPCHWCYWR